MVRPGGRVVPSDFTAQRRTVPVPGRGRSELGLAKPEPPAMASGNGPRPAIQLAPIQRSIRRKTGGVALKPIGGDPANAGGD